MMNTETVNPTFVDDFPTKVRVVLRQILQDGCTLRGFRSGGGLRVIRIEDATGELRGYGEHPKVMVAIEHAVEAYGAGGRTYEEQYREGGMYDHYLTGTSETSCPLDAWLLQGHSFKIAGSGYSLDISFGYTSLKY